MRHASVSVRLASVSPAARKCFACVSRASGLCVASIFLVARECLDCVSSRLRLASVLSASRGWLACASPASRMRCKKV